MTRPAYKHRCRWCGGPRVHDGSIAARVLDLLEEAADQRWWTAMQLAARLSRKPDSVRRALIDLKAAGLVHATRTSMSGPYEYARKRRPRSVDRTWPPTVTQGFLCSCGMFLPDPQRVGARHLLSAHHADHINPGRSHGAAR